MCSDKSERKRINEKLRVGGGSKTRMVKAIFMTALGCHFNVLYLTSDRQNYFNLHVSDFLFWKCMNSKTICCIGTLRYIHFLCTNYLVI